MLQGLPMKDMVSKYLTIRDILLYIANATRPTCAKEIAQYVTDMNERNTRIALLRLYQRGLLTRVRINKTWMYSASEETKSMYGANHGTR